MLNRSLDYSSLESQIRVAEETSIFSKMISTKLNYPDCDSDLKFPFLIAQLDCNPHDPVHFRILRSIYFLLTRTWPPLTTTGPHWEDIGFQGLDPCTDINRSMKMFAVLQVQPRSNVLLHIALTIV